MRLIVLWHRRTLRRPRAVDWEAFPGRAGQLTVYLFYYSERQHMPPAALQALYTRFFARLPTFKPGRARLIRPTFGYIPGWSRLTAPPRAPHPRIVLLGDAAARQSPLTFCGFGATLRSLQPVTQAIRTFLQHDTNNTALGMGPIQVDDRPIHSATGALALLMARPPHSTPCSTPLLPAWPLWATPRTRRSCKIASACSSLCNFYVPPSRATHKPGA